MPKFGILVAITGTAYATVEADSEEDALEIFNDGDCDLSIHEWDIMTDSSRGGFIDIEEEK